MLVTAIPVTGAATPDPPSPPPPNRTAVNSPGGAELPLAAFCGGSVLAMSYYGGIFSVLPAYIADLYGQKHSGAIHGAIMTAWSTSAVVGPMGLGMLRGRSESQAIESLLGQVNPEEFQDTFGAPIEQAG